MPDTAAILNEAYGLIEQGDLSRARTILQPLLESDSQNPDVWWLYTHAAADENEGRRALDRVQALDPAYPGSAELRERLGSGPRVLKPLSPLKPLPTPTAPTVPSPSSTGTTPAPVLTAPTSEPDLDDEFDEIEDVPQERGLSRMLILAGIAILVIAILLFGFSLLTQPPAPSETPTAIAGLGTDVGTPVATIDPLLVPTTDSLATPIDGAPTIDITTVVTIDSFSETATALSIVPTTVNAQSATEEIIAATDESLASVTDEAAVSTQNSLTVESTADATQDLASTEEAATQEATLDLPQTTQEATSETALVTQEAVVTEEPTATVEATLETPLATAEILVTEEITPEATEPAVTATEETSVIIPTEDVATLEATIDVTPTEEAGLILTEAVTAEATQDPLDTLTSKLEPLNVTRDDIVISKTTLGETLIVEVCAPPVASATTALTTAMSALAETVTDVIGIEAVGVNLSCDEERPFVIAVPASIAEAYGRGEIDTRTFRQGWAPTDLVEEESNG